MKNIVKHCIQTYMPASLLALIERQHYLKTLRNFEILEEPDLEVVKNLVPSGGIAIDVGANIGVYTRFLSEFVGEHGRVVSVEPMPRTFQIISNNVEQLKLSNVEVVNAAASSTPGSVSMELPSYQWGGKNYYQARISRDSQPSSAAAAVVPAITLDSLVESKSLELESISFVKVDVEGFELECVTGGSRILQHSGAAWLIEVSHDLDDEESPAGALCRLFTEQGYAPFINQGGQLVARVPETKSVNVFFLKPHHFQNT
jgi:FkbM family methyltransferase